jgi:hypothetical protein
MTPLVVLQITALMCFLYSLKIKMFKTNLIGFATISAALLSVTISLSDISFSDYHFIINTILLLFIAVYHTYKSYKRKRNV